jgi:hypothetical protein
LIHRPSWSIGTKITVADARSLQERTQLTETMQE